MDQRIRTSIKAKGSAKEKMINLPRKGLNWCVRTVTNIDISRSIVVFVNYIKRLIQVG